MSKNMKKGLCGCGSGKPRGKCCKRNPVTGFFTVDEHYSAMAKLLVFIQSHYRDQVQEATENFFQFEEMLNILDEDEYIKETSLICLNAYLGFDYLVEGQPLGQKFLDSNPNLTRGERFFLAMALKSSLQPFTTLESDGTEKVLARNLVNNEIIAIHGVLLATELSVGDNFAARVYPTGPEGKPIAEFGFLDLTPFTEMDLLNFITNRTMENLFPTTGESAPNMAKNMGLILHELWFTEWGGLDLEEMDDMEGMEDLDGGFEFRSLIFEIRDLKKVARVLDSYKLIVKAAEGPSWYLFSSTELIEANIDAVLILLENRLEVHLGLEEDLEQIQKKIEKIFGKSLSYLTDVTVSPKDFGPP